MEIKKIQVGNASLVSSIQSGKFVFCNGEALPIFDPEDRRFIALPIKNNMLGSQEKLTKNDIVALRVLARYNGSLMVSEWIGKTWWYRRLGCFEARLKEYLKLGLIVQDGPLCVMTERGYAQIESIPYVNKRGRK